jgi:O-antigen ligase
VLAIAALVGLLAGIQPVYGLGAAIGIAFATLVLLNLQAGLCVFAIAAFLDVLPFGGPALTLTKGIGLILALSWVAALATRPDTENDFLKDHPGFTYLLLAFLGWASASLLWAEDSAIAVDTVTRYAFNIILFLIVYTAVRNRSAAVWLMASFLLGALISAAYGIMSPVSPSSMDDVSRLSGAGVESNELAALLVAALVLATAFAAGWRESPAIRVFAGMTIVFCLAGVILSFSRGGLVALGVALLATVVLGGRWRPYAALLLVAIVTCAAGYVLYVATPEERARVTTVEGGTGRSDIWEVGRRMFEANPVTGIGAGNFPVSSIHYLLAPGALQRDEFIVDEPKVAHNIYLEVAAELGIVGFLLFMSILGFSLVSSMRAARAFMRQGDERMELISRAVTVAVIALLAADFFVSDQFSKQLWLLLALGPALLRIAQTSTADDQSKRQEAYA